MFLGIFLAGTLVVIGSMYAPLLEDYSNMVKESMISKYQYVMINQEETDNKNAEKFCLTTLETTDKKFMADNVSCRPLLHLHLPQPEMRHSKYSS